MDRIVGTTLDEQYVAFSLIDAHNLMKSLCKEGIINKSEYSKVNSFLKTIENRCGFQ